MPNTEAVALPAGQGSLNLVEALESAAAAERGCKTHEAIRFELKAALLRADLTPTDSPIIDVSRTDEAGHFLYEVLGAGARTYAPTSALERSASWKSITPCRA